jgi:hypothetical protein
VAILLRVDAVNEAPLLAQPEPRFHVCPAGVFPVDEAAATRRDLGQPRLSRGDNLGGAAAKLFLS